MAAKKSKRRKGKRKGSLQSAMAKGIAKGLGGGGKRGKKNQRPLPFLKKMAAKMEKNLPRLKEIIRQRGG
jgi:hypothetical protein